MVIKLSTLIFLILPFSSAQRCIFPGRYRDYTDSTGRLYYVCNEFGGTPIYFRCPKNNVFNDITHVCEATNSAQAECSWIQVVLGKTSDPDGDGTTYIDCTDRTLGPRIVKCVVGSIFSPIFLCCYDDDKKTCYN